MGRKRIYQDNAEKQRAYRKRAKQRKPPYLDPNTPCPKCGKSMEYDGHSWCCRSCFPKPPLPSVPTPTIIKTEPLTRNEYTIAKYISQQSEQPNSNRSGVTVRSSIIYHLKNDEIKCWTKGDIYEPSGEWTQEIIDNALMRLAELGLVCTFEKVTSWSGVYDEKTGTVRNEVASLPETHFFMVEEQRKALTEIPILKTRS